MPNYQRYPGGVQYGGTDTTQEDPYSSPRVPNGRRPTFAPPFSTIRRTSSPAGDTYSQTDRVPYSAPSEPAPGMASVPMAGSTTPVQMPYQDLERRQTEGLSPRGPSSPRPTSPYAGDQQQMAPMMNTAAYAPGAGTAPGMASPAGFSSSPSPWQNGQQNSQQRSGTAPYGSKERDELRKEHAALTKQLSDPTLSDTMRSQIQSAFDAVHGRLYGGGAGGATSGGSPSQQQSNGGAIPFYVAAPGMPSDAPPTFTNPQTGAPQKLQPIGTGPGERAPRDTSSPNWRTPQEEAAKVAMYKSAGASLDANPMNGMQPLQPLMNVPNGAAQYRAASPGNRMDTPVDVLTPTQAHQAVGAGPEQTARNMNATQRMQNSAASDRLQSNADQFAFNQNASRAIKARLQQFASGNFDTSQPLPAQTTAQTPQTAAAVQRAPVTQPSTQSTPPQSDEQTHVAAYRQAFTTGRAKLPPEAQATAQGVGGTIGPDGTMTTKEGHTFYWATIDGKPGFKRIAG